MSDDHDWEYAHLLRRERDALQVKNEKLNVALRARIQEINNLNKTIFTLRAITECNPSDIVCAVDTCLTPKGCSLFGCAMADPKP